MPKTVTWVLIADGTQARVLENTGHGTGLKTVEGLVWSIPPLQAGDINTDRPGNAPSGSNGGTFEPKTNAADHREANFVREVAEAIDKQASQRAYDKLIVAASPVALGTLRKAFSPQVQQTIIAELDKNLTNIPTQQLEKHLDGVIAF